MEGFDVVQDMDAQNKARLESYRQRIDFWEKKRQEWYAAQASGVSVNRRVLSDINSNLNASREKVSQYSRIVSRQEQGLSTQKRREAPSGGVVRTTASVRTPLLSGQQTTQYPYRSEYASAGITTREWSGMSSETRAKVAGAASAGVLRKSGTSSPVKTFRLNIVDRSGAVTRQYTRTERPVVVENEAAYRGIGKTDAFDSSKAGTYVVREYRGPRSDYFNFGQNKTVVIPRGTEYRPSAAPLLSTTIENVAVGKRPKVVGDNTRVEFTPSRVGKIWGKERITKSTTYQTTSGAQSQLAAMSPGFVGDRSRAGYGPVQFTLSTTEEQPNAYKRDVLLRNKGYQFLDQSIFAPAQRAGWGAVDIGLGLQARAERDTRSSSGLVRGYGRVERAGGLAYEYAGRGIVGASTYARENPEVPVLNAVAGGVAGGLGGTLATGASLGGKAWRIANFGYKSALAVAGGYYVASEGSAIVNAERPAERAGVTALNLASFGLGYKIGAAMVPQPIVTGTTIRSTSGVTRTVEGYPEGVVTRKGYVSTYWLGKQRRTSFVGTEDYFGGGVKGTIRYQGGQTYRYDRQLVTVNEKAFDTTRTFTFGGSQTAYGGRGVEATTVINRQYLANRYRWTTDPEMYLKERGVKIKNIDFGKTKGFSNEDMGVTRFQSGKKPVVYINTGKTLYLKEYPNTLRHEAMHVQIDEYGGLYNMRGRTGLSKVLLKPENKAFAKYWNDIKGRPGLREASYNSLEESFVYAKDGGKFRFLIPERTLIQDQIIYGRTAQPGRSGEFFGVMRGGKGTLTFRQNIPPPTGGWLTARVSSGTATESVFSPVSGFSVGTGSVSAPTAPAAPGLGRSSLFAPYGLYASSVVFGGVSSPVLAITPQLSRSESRVVASSITSPLSVARVTSISEARTASLVGTGVGVSEGVRVDPGVLTTPGALTGTRSVTDSVTRTTGGTSVPVTVPVTPPPFVPGFPGLPGFGFGLGRRSARGGAGARFRTGYNPSIVGSAFNIRGTRRQGDVAALTGIAVRPIV